MKIFNKNKKITSEDIKDTFKKIKFTNMQKLLLKDFNNNFHDAIKKIKNQNNFITMDEKIIIDNICDTLSVADSLIMKKNYIESLCIIRNAFEGCLICLAINNDDELYSIFIKFYQIRNKKEKDKIKPAEIRNKAADILKNVFKETKLNWYDWKETFDDYYTFLCEVVHPSIFKNYIFSVLKEVDSTKNIEILVRTIELYTRFILLVILKIITGEKDIEGIYDLFFLLYATMLMQMDNEIIIADVLEKNYDYLHREVNKKILDFKEHNNNSINTENFEFILKFMFFAYVSGIDLAEFDSSIVDNKKNKE